MNLGLFLSPGASASAWSPALIASSIYEVWDAEAPATITLVGNEATVWTSGKGLAAAGLVTAYPIYSATSFNGRPGLTFDGTNDCLTTTGIGALPSGATPFDLWLLVSQDSLAADTTTRTIASWGGGTAATCFRARRGVLTTNYADTLVGNGTTGIGATESDPEFSGIRVVRIQVTATDATISLDGTAGVTSSVVPAIGTTRMRIGAVEVATASGFFKGVINYLAATSPLSAGPAASMTAFLKQRGGVA